MGVAFASEPAAEVAPAPAEPPRLADAYRPYHTAGVVLTAHNLIAFAIGGGLLAASADAETPGDLDALVFGTFFVSFGVLGGLTAGFESTAGRACLRRNDVHTSPIPNALFQVSFWSSVGLFSAAVVIGNGDDELNLFGATSFGALISLALADVMGLVSQGVNDAAYHRALRARMNGSGG